MRIKIPTSALVALLVAIVPAANGQTYTYPSTTNINNFLLVGLSNRDNVKSINLDNGEYGADRKVLSAGGNSDTCDSSFPNLASTFDDSTRWGGNAIPYKYTDWNNNVKTGSCAPAEDTDWSGNFAMTSEKSQITFSCTDVYGDLNSKYGTSADIAIVAQNPVSDTETMEASSTPSYYPDGVEHGDHATHWSINPGSGDFPDVGFQKAIDLSALRQEINEWADGIRNSRADTPFGGYATECTYTVNDGTDSDGKIDNTYSRTSRGGTTISTQEERPFIIELRTQDQMSDKNPTSRGVDFSCRDVNGDGVIIVDIDLNDNDWSIGNSDVLFMGPDSVTAILRVLGKTHVLVSNSSVQRCEGKPGIMFALGVDKDEESGQYFSGSNAVINNVVFWELGSGADDGDESGLDLKMELNCQNCQGCSQFLGDAIVQSNNRWNKCKFEIPDDNGGAFGDPHFKTWHGRHQFEYHGACDIVLLKAPLLDMDIHIRTTIRYDYSYITQAAVRIGQEIFEVGSWGEYLLDGMASVDLPTFIGGYPITLHQPKPNKSIFTILLTDDVYINIVSFKDYVSVKVENGTLNFFQESTGIMGDFETGGMRNRAGIVLHDHQVYAEEWQVQPEQDGALFSGDRFPQYPEKCVLPSPTAIHARRLGEGGVSREQAEAACASWKKDKMSCIEDVLKTGDLDMALTGDEGM